MNNYFKFILLTIITTVTPLHPSQLPYKKSNFHERYTLLNQIGKGTSSTVFLSKDSRGELVAVKKYAIAVDEDVSDLLRQNGTSVDAYIKQLAQKELQIGQLTDHPNIVKIREVFFEDSAAYIVMDYVEGKPFGYFEEYPLEIRIILMQQFLSALEHFLSRNIIIDDLWSENILISHDGTHLTLVDLGGNEIIGHDAEMPVGHYLEMIESMLVNLGGEEATKVLNDCKHLLPTTLREETISPAHIRVLVCWIEAIKRELSTVLD